MERGNLSPRYGGRSWAVMARRSREGGPQAAETARGRVPMRGTGTDRLVVAMKPGNAGGAKGAGHPGSSGGQPRCVREEPVGEPKPKRRSRLRFPSGWSGRPIEKVKANQGAAGVDGESIAEFERDLKGNLYKLWNRMSSGTYFPPPVRAVEIPKAGGKGVRVARRAHRVGQDRPDGRAVVSGAGGGAAVPPRLLRLSAGAVRAGRGGGMPAAVLEEGLGDRSRHPGLLRQHRPRPRAARRCRSTRTCGGSSSTWSGG